MGEQLVVKDLPQKSDAIVVFSGDGEVSYQNLSYQKRALDAVELLTKVMPIKYSCHLEEDRLLTMLRLLNYI